MDITGLAISGGNFASFLMSDMMVRFILPFMLIFAVVFAILTKTKVLGDQREVLAIVSLAIGLLALQFDIVSTFFSVLFPKFGMWIAIFLIVLIFMGLFAFEFKKQGIVRIFMIIGGIIAAIVVLESFSATGYWGSSWISNYMDEIVWGGILIALIIFLINSGSDVSKSRFFHDVNANYDKEGTVVPGK